MAMYNICSTSPSNIIKHPHGRYRLPWPAVLRCLSRGVYSSARGGTGIGARSIPALLEVAATYDEFGRDGDLVYDPGLWLGLWPEDSVGLATA